MKHFTIILVFCLLSFKIFSQNYNIGDSRIINTCKANFYDAGGITGSAGYNNKLTTITSSDNNCVSVLFQSFDLGFGAELKIYEGNSPDNGIVLGTYSGTNIPPVFIASEITFEYIPPIFNTGFIPGWEASIKCVDCSTGQLRTDPASDCIGAIPLCSNNTVIVSVNQYNDTGNDNDDTGNCFSGTGNGGSVWYTFSPQSTGNLDFSISPDGSTDYDYVLYDATNGCNNLQEMSCNFSATYGTTGITTNSSDYQNSYSSCGGSSYYSAPSDCGVWNEAEAVNVNNTYMLMVNFYGGSNDGFTLQFQNDPSTVPITDNKPPTFANVTQPTCNGSQIHVDFSENIDCTTLQASDFTIAGYTISFASTGCVNGITNDVYLNINPVLPPGTYNLHGQDMSDMCGNLLNDDFSFTIANTPVTVSITGSDFCAGSSTTLTTTTTGTGLSYSWNNTATTSSITVNSGGNYCVTVTDACAQSANDCININALPAPSISTSVTCTGGGSSATLDMTGCTGTPEWFKWDEVCTTECLGVIVFGNCIGTWVTLCDYEWVSIGNTASVSVSSPFFSQYMAQCTAGNGCIDQEVVTVSCAPSLSVTVNSASICAGNCTNISATVSGGTSPFSYSWNPGTLSGAGPNNVCPSGTTTYSVTVTDATSATATASGTVTVNNPPIVNAGLDVDICSNDNTTLTASGASSYIWDNGLGAGASHIVSPSSSTTYTVTGTDANSCTDIDQVTITVNNEPTPTISGSLTFCPGFSTTLTASASVSYLWTGGSTAQTLVVSSAGTYSVTVTDGNGCTGTTSVVVSQNATLSPSISGVLAICSGNATTLDAGTYTSYLWSPGGETSQTISVSATGTYSVTVFDGGCSGFTSVNVNAYSNPTPTITGTLTYCAGSNTTLDAGAYTSYLWSTTATTQTVDVTTANNPVSVTVTDGNGCSGTDSESVTENALPTPTITGTLNYCAGSNTTLDAGSYTSYLWSTTATTQTADVTTADNPVSVTVTDGNGCSGTDSESVTENALPTPTITGTLDYCAGSNTTLDAGAFSSYDWSTGVTTQTTSATTTNNPVSVTVTDGNGCTGTDTENVIENALPTPTITGTLVFCDGLSSTLDAGLGYSNYTWSPSGNTQTLNVTTSGTYAVTVTDANGCEGIDDVTVTVNPTPTAVFTVTQPLCHNSAGTVTFTGSSTATTLFNWDFDGGVAIPGTGAGPHSVTWATSGSKTISLIVTDTGGCTNDTSFSITVPEQLIIDSNSKIDVLCNGGNSGSISVVASGGTGQIMYSISGTPKPNGFFSNLVAGNYIVTVTDANSCSVTTNQITIFQPTALSLSVNSGDNICAGTSYNINSNCNGGTTPFIYTWKDGSGNIIGGNNSSITVSPNNTSLYFVNVVDANNCNVGPVVSTLNVSPPISFSYTTQNVSCKNKCDGEITFNAIGGVPPFTYTDPADNWTATLNIVSNLCDSIYSAQIEDSWGCQKDTMFTITEPLALTFSTISKPSICNGTPTGVIYIDVTAGTGTFPYSYNWSNGGSTTDSLVAGVGRYYFTITDANNCQILGSDSISQPLPIKYTAPENMTICKGQTVILEVENPYGGTQPYTFTWIWTSPEDSITHVGTGTNLSVSPNLLTNYYLSAKDFNGCISSLNATITVNVNPDITADVFPTEQTICPGDSVFVNTEISGGNGGPYLCTLQDGTIVTENFYIYPEGQDTTIYYTYTAKDLCGSPNGTYNFNIKILPLPPVSIFADTLFGCQPLKVSFMDSSKYIGQSYFWTFTNTDANVNSFSYSKYPTINFTEAGVYDVTLIATSIDGCKDSITEPEMITVYPNPISEFEADPQVQSKINPDFYFQNLSSTTYSCEWDFGDDNFSNEINPAHTYLNIPGNYLVELTVETENGCFNTSSTTVIVKDEYTFFTATAFSPDNDGINDVFFISASGIDPKFFHLIIYDRWGEIVYETKSYNPENPKQYGWDGSVKGLKKAEVGTYTWLCNYKNLNGEERQQAGPITIIR